ncbi:Fe-S protein assembly chaperone HscA [Kangiella geojedonensis]|uniref:Chaperone protein HscA homolog n=1 Tax=Kangiella geojedonensis TaxID=914150 RepID=A0A0F6RBX1_9GAMM|nr:Fe-S protein assembly chaperone HscA [Kangiella geojedonensis]AKE51913.1 chaperone protein HscA [Kangiella geojedonensis]
MALLQISEPGQSTEPHQHKLAAGIDLGTTNSLIATVRSGKAETLADANGKHTVPSVVHYMSDDNFEVGHKAKEQQAIEPGNVISSIKRLMGRGLADMDKIKEFSANQLIESESGMPGVVLDNHVEKNPVEVSSDILRTLAERAEQTLGGELGGVVITVPAYFDEAQRQATKDAAQLAGLKVLRLLNEPTAAAVAYGLDSGSEGIHAIYDLGGGTFDISILRLQKGVFEVLATGGDSALGGDDFDRAIAHYLVEQANVDSDDRRAHQLAMIKARDIKEALTDTDTVEVNFLDWNGQMSRTQIEEIIAPIVDKTLLSCRRTLKDAGIKVDEVDKVVMVGGSTRVPLVREKVEQHFKVPPLTDIDPDKVVAIGAAIQANVLIGNKSDDDMLLLDVIPLSLGVETMGGLAEKIIPRNTPIPIAKAQEFTTFKDGQTAMAIHVVQGERELVEDCRSLARFELRGIPPMVAGAARIKVTYQVDADGLLQVLAEETTSGVKADITVKPSYGLSDDQITNMLQSSFSHAEGDMEARMLREQKVEAARVIEAVSAALNENGKELLSEEEYTAIQSSLEQLNQTSQGDSIEAIENAIEIVEKNSNEFASRRMDASIAKALVGHEVDEI